MYYKMILIKADLYCDHMVFNLMLSSVIYYVILMLVIKIWLKSTKNITYQKFLFIFSSNIIVLKSLSGQIVYNWN